MIKTEHGSQKNNRVTITNNNAKYYSNLAKESEINAKSSEESARKFAQQAIDSARLEQVDWEENDNTLKSFIKNKPNTVYTAGDGISIKNNVISNTRTSAEWGNVQGNISEQDDLQNTLNLKADKSQLLGYSDINLSNISDSAKDVIKNHAGLGLNLFDLIQSDHILSFEESKGKALLGTYVYKTPAAGERYGYPDFYNKCVEEMTNGVEIQITVGNYTFTGYVNTNKHIFYNISDKEIVDNIYNSTGMAWYYGVDTENERIFLPRNNKYFMCANSGDVGSFVEAGLPNIKGREGDPLGYATKYTQGAFYTSGVNNGIATTSAVDYDGAYHYFDASRSNPIYGNSDTVQTDAVKLLVYMIVGNTESESALTDIVDVTTTENDTIPLGFSVYSQNIQPSVSWLKSSGQWNSGNVYTTFYSWLVNQLDGIENVKSVRDSTITDYDFVLNEDDMTFRLPLKNGQESMFLNSTAPVVGNGMTMGFTNGNGGFGLVRVSDGGYHQNADFRTGDFGLPVGSALSGTVPPNGSLGLTTDPTKSGIYADLTTEVPNNYNLYYKVSNAVENLQILDVGAVTEALVDKADRDLSNCTKPYVTETYKNGASWYRVWSDGWCEQGGSFGAVYSSWQTKTITFLISFIDVNYFPICNLGYTSQTDMPSISAKTPESVTFANTYNGTGTAGWYACGYKKG